MKYAYKQDYDAAASGKDISANIYPSLSDNFYQFEAGYFDYILEYSDLLSA